MLHERDTIKIGIIGAGFVGATTAYALMMSGIASEIVIVDINKEKALGEAMDLNHGMAFVKPVTITASDYSGLADADIVIITAGANQKEGETRIDLVNKNLNIFKGIVPEIVKYAKDAIILVVTNPVDILTYATYKISGFPKNRVIGSGTVLDTSRLKYQLSEHCGIDARNIHAYIIGEHGDTELPAWSITSIAGSKMDEFCAACCDNGKNHVGINKKCKEEIHNSVKNAAYEIITRKGATYFAVALAVKRIVEAIVRDEKSILTVSSLLEGQFGLKDVCISLPTIVNRNGIKKVLEVNLDEHDKELFLKSANAMKEVIDQLDI